MIDLIKDMLRNQSIPKKATLIRLIELASIRVGGDIANDTERLCFRF